MIDLTKIRLPLFFLLGALILVLTGFFIGKSVLQSMNYNRKADHFEKELYKKEALLQSYVAKIQERPDTIFGITITTKLV